MIAWPGLMDNLGSWHVRQRAEAAALQQLVDQRGRQQPAVAVQAVEAQQAGLVVQVGLVVGEGGAQVAVKVGGMTKSQFTEWVQQIAS